MCSVAILPDVAADVAAAAAAAKKKPAGAVEHTAAEVLAAEVAGGLGLGSPLSVVRLTSVCSPTARSTSSRWSAPSPVARPWSRRGLSSGRRRCVRCGRRSTPRGPCCARRSGRWRTALKVEVRRGLVGSQCVYNIMGALSNRDLLQATLTEVLCQAAEEALGNAQAALAAAQATELPAPLRVELQASARQAEDRVEVNSSHGKYVWPQDVTRKW